MADQTRVLGVDELVKKLEALNYDIRKKGGRFALRKAAQVIQKAAVANALRVDDPKSAEQIARNITIRWSSRLNKSTGDLGFRVGVAGGAKQGENAGGILTKGPNPGGDTWYWRLVEFGSINNAARPFMRPALENNIDASINEFVVQYEKSIDRILKRASK